MLRAWVYLVLGLPFLLRPGLEGGFFSPLVILEGQKRVLPPKDVVTKDFKLWNAIWVGQFVEGRLMVTIIS